MTGCYGTEDGLPEPDILTIIREVSGTQLTSDVVDAFMRLVAKGKFRAPDDEGGGTTENIDNIHKAQNEESKSSGT